MRKTLLLEAVMPSIKVSPALVIDSKCQSESGRTLLFSSTQLSLPASSMLNTYCPTETAPSRFTLASSVNGFGRVSGFRRKFAVVWPAGKYHDGHLAAARQFSGGDGELGGGDVGGGDGSGGNGGDGSCRGGGCGGGGGWVGGGEGACRGSQ